MNPIIYNVTLGISPEIHDEWLQWMRTEHIPEILETGKFTSARILKVHFEHTSAPTYAVQYSCPNMQRYEEYLRDYAPAIQAAHQERFGEHAHAIRTVLEVVCDVLSK